MAFGSRLKRAEVIQSVGKPASCRDKIVAESFFATLKKERVCRRSWPLRRTSEMEIFDYIEIF
jgi:putative transposase